MNNPPEYKLQKIAGLLKIGIFYITEKGVCCCQEHNLSNPLYLSNALREDLMKQAEAQTEPYIYKDDYQVCFACLKSGGAYYFAGPMSLKLLSRLELHQYYRHYGINGDNEKRLRHFTFSEVLDIAGLLAGEILLREYSYDELNRANHFIQDTKEQIEKEQVFFQLKEDEDELYHHTYQEERKLLDCVRNGAVEDAILYSRNMDVDLGKLSEKEISHWKNVAVVAITLCTRAAIEGGLSPSIAYRLSDFYIQKSDSSSDIAQIIEYRNQAVKELTSRVLKQQKSRSMSNYVERCKDYVEKHYREKIYQEEIADVLGISPTYLSKLFHRETEMRLQDYIVQVRVEHAANLLIYSDESIARIAEYVNFPSQSYLGKVFKARFQMSPKKYRELKKPAEF
ncbi:hypothetical protein GCM10008910_00580 [Faecalicatena orotica]|uniref:AraC-like DNA-binding protein n=2 Tax=Faecalicatena orotica TaxID=1544 RepID=A0A2Y9BLU9_9FIRM|nr:AraC-like DNA-binding protein [Faecalicatena orotica]SSA58371.1 AraC-type DNA-binding protein [Faecalicatena orotica]